MNLSNSLVFNRKLKLFIKIIFAIIILGTLIFFLFQLGKITDRPFSEVEEERRFYYSMIGLIFIFVVFYILSSSEYSDSISEIRGIARTELRENNEISKSDRMDQIREIEIIFFQEFMKRQVLFVTLTITIYLIIVFTVGIFDIIAKIGAVVTLIYYYRKYKENPVNILNKKKFRDKKMSLDETSTIAIAETKGRGMY